MPPVQYGQKGYEGVSMSKNASTAHELGEKTISQIRKEDADFLTELITKYAPDHAPAKALTVTQAKYILLRRGLSSWHHTGKYAKATDFYHPSAIFEFNKNRLENFEEELTEEHIKIFNIRIKTWKEDDRKYE